MRGRRGAPRLRGKGASTRTHLLVLVGTHRAGHRAPPGRTAFATTKIMRGQWPQGRGVPLLRLGLLRHTLSTADESLAGSRSPGSAKPSAEDCKRGASGLRNRRASEPQEREKGVNSRDPAPSLSLLLLAPSLPAPSSCSSRKRSVFLTFRGAA